MKAHRFAKKGSVFFCVIACLAVVISILLSSVQSSLRSRQQMRMHRQLQQAALLCDAGAVRAREKLANDSSYAGETWKPKLFLISGEVTEIVIHCSPMQNDQKPNCTVQVKIFDGPESVSKCQRTKQFIIQMEKP